MGEDEVQRFYRWFNSTNWLTDLATGTPAMAVNLSALDQVVKKWPSEVFDAIELRLENELREVLRSVVEQDGELIAVDINHSAWKFRPWAVSVNWGEPWPVALMPTDWCLFVNEDFSGGVVGDPRTRDLRAFGARFVGGMRGRDWGSFIQECLRIGT